MFYGDFAGEKKQSFSNAINSFSQHFKRVYAADNLITFNRNQSYLKDEAFMAAFRPNVTNEQEKSLIWRVHTVCWAAQHCRHIEGDFVECGVYLGFTMSVVAAYLDFDKLDKTMYLYDTFEGIPEAYNSENRSNRVYEEQPDIYGRVLKKFEPYSNVKVVKGIVPDTFKASCPEKIAFLHIDMNSSKSEIAALEHLYDKVQPGGIIIFDDFGWMGYDKQTWAEIEWMKERGQHILELPTGQGVLIKH